MRTRLYTNMEIRILETNKNVIKVKYSRQIEYNPEFKLQVVLTKRKYPNYSCREIFEMYGMETFLLDKKTPQRRINDWNKKFEQFGYSYFTSSGTYTIDKKYLLDNMKKTMEKFKNEKH